MRPFRGGISKAIYCTIASLLIGQLASPPPARADKRVALVIGNGAYMFVPRLSTPPGDAAAMAKMLSDAGFDVVTGTDLTRAGMADKKIEFERRLACADLAVLYFAGHGLALNKVNYILPVDANFKSEIDIKLGAVDFDSWLLSSGTKVKVVLLDAGHDERLNSTLKSISLRDGSVVQSGLVAGAPEFNSFFVLSTPPGQQVPDRTGYTISPFAQALIDQIARPGVDVGQALTNVRTQLARETDDIQISWPRDVLLKKNYLNPVQDRDAVVADLEERLYKWISDTELRDVEKLTAYLKLFPRGKFSGLVRARISELNSSRPFPPVYRRTLPYMNEIPLFFPPSLRDGGPGGAPSLNACTVQRQLNVLGYQTGIPGRLDGQTRLAIRSWQAARGYPDDGIISGLQSLALAAEGAAAEAGIFNETLFRAPIKD